MDWIKETVCMGSNLEYKQICSAPCTVNEVSNKTFIFPRSKACYKLETFEGGEFVGGSINEKNPCTKDEHNLIRKWSEFDASTSTNRVIHYKKWENMDSKWSGSVTFQEVIGSTSAKFAEFERTDNRTFDGVVSLPSCDYGCATLEDKIIELDLTQDFYPRETSWYIKNECSGEIVKTGNAFGCKVCLDGKDSYSFTIEDSEGDGICCRYGQGSYKLTYDNEVLKEGGEFRFSETTVFGGTC